MQDLEALIEKAFAGLTFGKQRADAFDGVGRAENPMTPEGMENLRRKLAKGIMALK